MQYYQCDVILLIQRNIIGIVRLIIIAIKNIYHYLYYSIYI